MSLCKPQRRRRRRVACRGVGLLRMARLLPPTLIHGLRTVDRVIRKHALAPTARFQVPIPTLAALSSQEQVAVCRGVGQSATADRFMRMDRPAFRTVDPVRANGALATTVRCLVPTAARPVPFKRRQAVRCRGAELLRMVAL